MSKPTKAAQELGTEARESFETILTLKPAEIEALVARLARAVPAASSPLDTHEWSERPRLERASTGTGFARNGVASASAERLRSGSSIANSVEALALELPWEGKLIR